ncbi:hypothetical protein O1R50_00445 [Glycomyces luteolus]|uniref:Uncharacterized protein n=1 Tax=Glycomyces luteolus TaxID=2670330 RepID=A0A9X3P6Z5_9ACTN|nr:hypothetical protein [Glycomyces luteolus]MDA1358073.1 hypothetical protein [Glycomyces luteolus]
MPSQDPIDPDSQPETAASAPEMPILVRPIPRPKRPKVISTVRILTGVQVALVMVTGNCSFGIPLAGAIAWPAERFNWHEDPGGIAILWAWVIGFAAIFTYACFTNRWAGEADRRARTTIIIGTAVLVGLTALTIPIMVWEPALTTIILIAAAPSLILQAIVLRCAYGPQGRRWFNG